MTVAELINELEQIENKSAEVIMASEDYLPIKEVWIFPMKYGYVPFLRICK